MSSIFSSQDSMWKYYSVNNVAELEPPHSLKCVQASIHIFTKY